MGSHHAGAACGRGHLSEYPCRLHPVYKDRLLVEEHHRQDLQEDRSGRGRDHPAAGGFYGACLHRRHGQHRRRHRRDHPRRPGRRVLDVDLGAVRHGHQVLRSYARRQVPRAQRKGRLVRRPDVLHQKRPWSQVEVAGRHLLHFRRAGRVRYRQYLPDQLHRFLRQLRCGGLQRERRRV